MATHIIGYLIWKLKFLGQEMDLLKNFLQVLQTVIKLGKKFIEHHPQEKKPRAERSHVKEGVSGHLEDVPYGIKTFPPIHCEKRHEVEEMMGKK